MRKDGAVPLVSVIIPTYNSHRTIQQCLQSIERQTYKRIEKIIVDRYSTDETTQIAKLCKAKVFSLNCERSEAKNFGAEKANGSFLLFIDSDMELNPKNIEECVELCTEKNFDAAVIPEITVAIGFLAKCRKLERELYNYDFNFSLLPRFFKKNTFLNVLGFDEKLIYGEDFDLARRYEKQGYRIGIITSSIKHLEGQLSFKRVVLKAYYYGQSLLPIFSKEPTLALREYCPTRFALNIKRLLRQPMYLVGLATIKLFEYSAYLIGIFADALGRTQSIRETK